MPKFKATAVKNAAQENAPKVGAALAPPKGKLGEVVKLLRRPEGATIADMSAATGWQAHSVRGALSGAVKRKHGLAVSSEKTDAGRVYRIAEGVA